FQMSVESPPFKCCEARDHSPERTMCCTLQSEKENKQVPLTHPNRTTVDREKSHIWKTGLSITPRPPYPCSLKQWEGAGWSTPFLSGQ
ncbi:hypothetical protein PMAYCL1PPCAC_22921, partial [Pristionchus mayeri]